MKTRFHKWKSAHGGLSTKGKLIFVLSYIILITLLDSYSYGIIYQQKIKQEGYTNPVWNWVFKESGEESAPGGGTEHITVPRYRMIQKSTEIAGLIIVFYFCGLWCAIGLITAHYFMSFDFLFYIFVNKTYLFAEFEKYNSTYWLQNPYQIGYFILNPFNAAIFYISGIAGIVVSVSFCFIKSKGNK